MEELSSRHRDILRAIISEHVTSGDPVGSSSIAGRDVPASPATVRSVMADLEELGYLEKPHASAGRIPTDRGYRYYVDAFVQLRPPTRPERELIEKRLPQDAAANDLLRETSKLLSTLSHHAAVVLTPSFSQAALKRIEFIKLKEDRALAVLVLESGIVQNRLLPLDCPVEAEELVRAANFLNEQLAHTPIDAIRDRLLALLTQEKSEYDALLQQAVALGRKAFDEPPADAEVLIEGQGSFFDAKEFTDHSRMQALFRAFEEKSKLLALLDGTLSAREVQIYIGAETEFSARPGVSVVAAPYSGDAGVIGTIGVIGPTRMNYSRAVTLVDFTARLISRRLEQA